MIIETISLLSNYIYFKCVFILNYLTFGIRLNMDVYLVIEIT